MYVKLRFILMVFDVAFLECGCRFYEVYQVDSFGIFFCFFSKQLEEFFQNRYIEGLQGVGRKNIKDYFLKNELKKKFVIVKNI